MRQLRSELLKLSTIRLPLTLVAVTAGFVGLITAVTILVGDGPHELTDLLGGAAAASFFVFVLGLLALTGEYRHGTLTPTYTAVPRRARVYLAKLGALALAGLITAALALLAAWLVALVATAAVDAELVGGDVWGLVARTLLLYAGMSLLGVGIGAIVRIELAAVVGGLVYLFIAESLLTSLAPSVGRWLVFTSGTAFATGGAATDARLAWWTAGLVFVAYLLAALVAGLIVTLRSDIAE